MPDAWDLLPEKERKADTVATFIIFCEDKETEPSYFEGFQRMGKLKVNVVPNQKQGSWHINNAIAYCKKNDLIEIADRVYRLKPNVTEHIWCVFDRDLENENIADINPANDNDFTDSIDNAERKGLKVAWSNDAFELWILLHFENVPTGQILHRQYIYDRLTYVFRQLENKPQELETAVLNPQFSYKEKMKKRISFMRYV